MRTAKDNLHLRLFSLSRTWHIWLGLTAVPLTIVLSLTGIWLNHRDLFSPGAAKPPLQGLLTTDTAVKQLPVTLEQALGMARHEWGVVPIEKIEVLESQGRLVYKIMPGSGRELFVDAHSGSWKKVDGYRIREGADDQKPKPQSINWNRLMKDLHTGKFAGTPGKLVYDAVALALIVLAGTGLYLWALPRWKKRRRSP